MSDTPKVAGFGVVILRGYTSPEGPTFRLGGFSFEEGYVPSEDMMTDEMHAAIQRHVARVANYHADGIEEHGYDEWRRLCGPDGDTDPFLTGEKADYITRQTEATP